jgi:hypothetical protein
LALGILDFYAENADGQVPSAKPTGAAHPSSFAVSPVPGIPRVVLPAKKVACTGPLWDNAARYALGGGPEMKWQEFVNESMRKAIGGMRRVAASSPKDLGMA